MQRARQRCDKIRLGLLLVTLLTWQLCLSHSADAAQRGAGAPDLDRLVEFHIAAQPLDAALLEFSRQASIPLALDAKELAEQEAPVVDGKLPARSALMRLLDATGLKYETVGNTIAIVRVAQAPEPRTSSATPNRRQLKEKQKGATEENPPTGNPNGGVEEVVVTAQKRNERLVDVPISISVLGGQDLDRSPAEGLTEALRSVPGVATTVAFQGGGTQLAVRGVAAAGPLFVGSSPVGFYLDSAPFGLVRSSIAPDPNAYDLERVEVLRGPQGTLYGASALNGVVRVLTNDAELNTFALKARTSVSGTDHGSDNSRVDMAVNVPLIDDTLAARAVLGYERIGGWIDTPNRKDANDAELLNARLKLNAQPTDKLSIALSGWLSRSDYGAPDASQDNRETSARLEQPMKNDYDLYAAKVAYEFDAFSVSSSTSYLDYASNSFIDQGDRGAPGTRIQTLQDSNMFSEEVNAASSRGGLWRWTLGGIYRTGKDRLFQAWPPVLKAPVDLTFQSDSFAGFGELTRLLFGGMFELTGGMRYFEDRVTSRADSFLGLPANGVYARDKFDAVSPRGILTWHAAAAATVYASYSEGFRSGTSQNPNITAIGIPPASPDKLKNYELGSKGNLLNGHMQIDTAVYYIKWEDVQQSLLVSPAPGTTPVSATVNGKSASGMGVDFGVTVEPINSLSFGVDFSWNNLTNDSNVLSGGVVLQPKGSRLNFSPQTTAGASASYAFQIATLEARLSASADYVSKERSLRLANGVALASQGDNLLFGRTSFSLASRSGWTVTLYADNVTNEQGAFMTDTSGNDPERTIRPQPRTVGVQLDWRVGSESR